MTISEMSRQMSRMSVRLNEEISSRIPDRIGNRLVSAFKKNFQDESFFGKPWREVKRRSSPGKGKAGKASSRRKILTGETGNLGRSIQYETRSGEVTVFSDVPYADAHNEGTTTAGRGHGTEIPQRQFIGDSPEVQRIIEEEIQKGIERSTKD